jgi:hypothetical protein
MCTDITQLNHKENDLEVWENLGEIYTNLTTAINQVKNEPGTTGQNQIHCCWAEVSG